MHNGRESLNQPFINSFHPKAQSSFCLAPTPLNKMILIKTYLPPTYRADNLLHSAYLPNLIPSIDHTLLYGTPPIYSHLRVFGCVCYPNLTATTPLKLSSRSTLCLFLGYPPQRRGYKCPDLQSNQIIISRHVTFDEITFPYVSRHTLTTDSYQFLNSTDDVAPFISHPASLLSGHQYTASSIPYNHSLPPSPPGNTYTSTPSSADSSDTTTLHSPSPPPLPCTIQTHARSGIYKPSPKYDLTVQNAVFKPKAQFHVATSPLSSIPKTYRSALKDTHWSNAMPAEINALVKNRTWDLVMISRFSCTS